jgi:pimeloyl-ACP methyl ester carboxylesterase
MTMYSMPLSGTTDVSRKTASVFVLIGLVLVLTSMGIPVLAQDEAASGSFEEAECPMMMPGDVNITCGYLSVPEVHGDANSRTIRLAVAILHSRSDQPQPDPVVHLHGGPGQGDLLRIFGYLNSSFLDERDLIVVDQRGVGFSEPALACPEVDDATLNSLMAGSSREELIAADVAGAAACRDRLQAEGIALEAYNTLQSAADFESLRLALGYDQWNLYGTSYGVLPTLTMMRLYPESIRSVTLEATMPLQQTAEETAMFGRALNEVFTGCASDASCNEAYPQLADQFGAAVERLNEQPVILSVQIVQNGGYIDVSMDGQLFANILFSQLYTPASIPFVPFMIAQAANGNGQVMTIPASQLFRLLRGGIDTGDRLSVTCQDILPFSPAEEGSQTAQAYPYLTGVQIITSWSIQQVCQTWDVPAANSDFAQPVSSPIPTLFLHGQYDPRLTTDYDVQVAATLPNSYIYVVPGVSHQALLTSPCAQTIAAAFVSDPTHEPASNCLTEVPVPAWVLPSAVYATPAMVNLIQATMEPLNPLTLLLVVICLVVFVIALISAVRGKTQTPAIRWLSGLVALLSLVTLGSLIGIILTTLRNGTLIGFGIPGAVAAIRFLPLITGAFAVVLAVMVVSLWLRRIPGSTRSAIFTSAVAIAGLFVSGWLLRLGFLP